MTREILIVEDEAAYRKSVIRLFSKKGYRFVEAASAEEAIEKIDANPYLRVVILDLNLGSSSGALVLEHIKPRASDYRVVVLTSHEELLRAERARAYDVFTYLTKAEHSAESIRFSIQQAFADLERAELHAKLERLLEVEKKINAHAPLRKTLDLICRSVLATVGGYTCHIRVYHFSRGDYFTEGYAGAEDQRAVFERPRAKGDLFSGRVVYSGRMETFTDLQSDRGFREFAAVLLSKSRLSVERQYWKSIRSACLVPISTGIFGDHVDAVLNVSSEKKDFFTEERLQIVGEFAAQAALAITRDWLDRKRQEASSDFQEIGNMLYEISDGLRTRNRLDSIYKVVTQKIFDIINAEIVSIFLYDNATGLLELCAEQRGDGMVQNLTEAYTPGQRLTGMVYSANETLHLPEEGTAAAAADDDRFDAENRDLYLRNIPSGRMQHYLGVPIRIDGRPRGVLRAVNKRSALYDPHTAAHNPLVLLERGFSDDCRNAMEIAATHLAVAIQNAELVAEKDRQFQQLKTIGNVGRLINSARDLREVMRQTIKQMAQVMEAEICLLFLLDESGERVVLEEASFGVPAGRLAGVFYALGEGATGRVARDGGATLIGRASVDNGKYDREIIEILSARHGEPTGITSVMVVALEAKDKIVGVMKVINKVGGTSEFTEDDLSLFGTFASYVVVAMTNAEANEALKREENAVEDRNRALSLLVSAVAHEINNTIGVVPVTVDSIRAELDVPSARVIEMLSRLQDVAEQTLDFANELGGFSARRMGEKQPFDLNEMITEAVRELGPALDRYDGDLELSLSERPILCDIYRTPFKQIIRNIVLNAFQALDGTRPGLVRITTAVSRQSGLAEVAIQDNGIGIRPEYLPKIFDPEFTTKRTGNGLGLWLAKTQLQMLHGSIDVDSKVGRGSRFVVRLPRVERGEERS
jgi:signal transduction histidine kinase/CheY-like chemotaxis protein